MKRIIALILSIVTVFGVSIVGFADNEKVKPQADVCDFVNVNGIKMEYAVYGSENEQVVLLLPPNGNDMHAFDGNVLPYLAEKYKVITVSPRGTGNSERGDGELTFEVMADDVKCMLDEMQIDKVYIFGFSDGGNLGLVFTLRYPDTVEKLAIMGANINPYGTKLSSQIGIIFEYVFYKIKYFFTKDPSDALAADIQGLMVNQPTLKFEDLENINIPVLNIYGQSDMMYRSHSKNITKHIKNCEEIMVKGGGHTDCFDYTDTLIAPSLLEFFDKQEGIN